MIEHQMAVPYFSQQNEIAERSNRTMVERTVALPYSERLPFSAFHMPMYWPFLAKGPKRSPRP